MKLMAKKIIRSWTVVLSNTNSLSARIPININSFQIEYIDVFRTVKEYVNDVV